MGGGPACIGILCPVMQVMWGEGISHHASGSLGVVLYEEEVQVRRPQESDLISLKMDQIGLGAPAARHPHCKASPVTCQDHQERRSHVSQITKAQASGNC